MSVVKITQSNFEEEVLKSEKPVLIDFWASWCGSCRMLSPLVDEVAEEQSQVKVGKVNVDEENALALEYGIMSIPCLMLFKNGKLEKQSVGAIPKEAILEFIK